MSKPQNWYATLYNRMGCDLGSVSGDTREELTKEIVREFLSVAEDGDRVVITSNVTDED